MDIRKAIQGKPVVGIAITVVLLAISGMILARQYWPEKRANLSETYFTDDDGNTWFADSAYLVPPFDHNGRTAVFAQVFSYDNGSKKYCAYESKFTDKAKERLEAALAEAQKNNQPPSSVSLYRDRTFMSQEILVKQPGSEKWIPMADPQANSVCSVHSPDGSAVDQCFVY
jgi:hypothetical protein